MVFSFACGYICDSLIFSCSQNTRAFMEMTQEFIIKNDEKLKKLEEEGF